MKSNVAVKTKRTQARQALADQLANIADIQQRLTTIRGPLAKLREAQDAQAKAQADLNAVIESDKADLEKWAEAGAVGEQPTPHTKERQKAAAALADARARAEAASRAGANIEVKAQQLNAQLGLLHAELPALKRAVLMEEAHNVGALYKTLAVNAMKMEQRLLSLSRLLGYEGRVFGPDGATVGPLAGQVSGMLGGRFDADPEFKRARAAWLEFWTAMDSDPDAPLKE